VLRGDRANTDIAREYGCGEASVRRAKERLGIVKVKDVPTPPTAPVQRVEVTEDKVSADIPSDRPLTDDDVKSWLIGNGVNPEEFTWTLGWTVQGSPGDGVERVWNKLRCTRIDDRQEAVRQELEKACDRAIGAILALKLPGNPDTGVSSRTRIAAFGDGQLGKAGEARGNWVSSIDLFTKAVDTWTENKGNCNSIVLADMGDLIENCYRPPVPKRGELGGLTLTRQLELAMRMELAAVTGVSQSYQDVTLLSVPSNHGGYRQNLNTASSILPGDDFGVMVARMVGSAAEYLGFPLKVLAPEVDYQPYVVLRVQDLTVCAIHGHQVQSASKMEEWWKGQTFGRQTPGEADLLIHGHFHHAAINTCADGRVIVGVPAFEPGSGWYSALKGVVSPPGFLSFLVEGDQFNIESTFSRARIEP